MGEKPSRKLLEARMCAHLLVPPSVSSEESPDEMRRAWPHRQYCLTGNGRRVLTGMCLVEDMGSQQLLRASPYNLIHR